MGLYEDALAASQSRVSPALPQESVPDVSGILAAPSAKPVKSIGEEFASGLAEGTLGLATGVGGVLKVAGDAIGSETLSQVGKDTINYWRSASAPYASDVPSYKNVQGFNDAMKYLAHGVGTIVPTSVMSLGAGGIGAGIARRAIPAALERAMVVGPISEEIAKDVASGVVAGGTIAGAGTASYGMELGQIGEQQAGHNVNAPGTALAYAVPAAALDVVAELPILAKSGIVKELRKIPGLNEETGNIAARFAKGAGKQAILEGGQEAAQSALESLGAQQPLDREDIINSAIIGAAGGVVMGGPTSALGGHHSAAPAVADTKKATVEALLQKAAGDPTPLGALVDQNASGMKGYLDVMQRLSAPQPAFQATANEDVSAPVVTAPPTAGQFGDVVPGAPAAERLSVLQDGIPAFEHWGRQQVDPEAEILATTPPAVPAPAGYLGEEIPGAPKPLNSYPAGLPQVMNPETLPSHPEADVIGEANPQLRPTSSVAADRVGVETPKAGASLGQFGTKQEMYRYALEQTGTPEGARAWMQKMYATEAAPVETKAPAAQPEAVEPEVPQGVTKRDFLKAKKDALAAVLTEGLDTATRKYRELTAQAETIDGDSVVTKKETSTIRGWQEVLKGYGVFVGEDRRSDSARRAAISAMSPTQMQAELLTSHLTDMPNKRAYESTERKPVQVAIDADNLKWVNDNMGHGNGDQLLQKVGAALKAETGLAYHVSGDEFIVEADTAEQAREIMFRVNQKLASEELRYVAPNGKTLAKKGLEISYGIGNDLHTADAQLRQNKKGKKVGRGALPSGVVKFSRGGTTPFFSKVRDLVEQKLSGATSFDQLKKMLKNNGATDDEITQTLGGLEGKTKVSKAEVLSELKANSVELKDVVLGTVDGSAHQMLDNDYTSGRISFEEYDRRQKELPPDDEVTPTHFSQYTEPGAKEGSYREMFVTVPGEGQKTDSDVDRLAALDFLQERGLTGVSAEDQIAVAVGLGFDLQMAKLDRRGMGWKDGHSQYSDIQNPVVRIRFNERDADGKRILFVEEMQGPSDAEQAKMPEYLRKRIYDLGVKRVLAYAKENGFDGIIWTSGAMQAKRYDLSKQVDKIEYWDQLDHASASGKQSRYVGIDMGGNGTQGLEVDPKTGEVLWAYGQSSLVGKSLDDVVGKEPAKKILTADGAGEITEDGLKVGGEGLKRLYDQTLPALFKKYGKAGVEEISFGNTDNVFQDPGSHQWFIDGQDARYKTEAEANASAEIKASYIPVTQSTPDTYTMFSRGEQSDSRSERSAEAPAERVSGVSDNAAAGGVAGAAEADVLSRGGDAVQGAAATQPPAGVSGEGVGASGEGVASPSVQASLDLALTQYYDGNPPKGASLTVSKTVVDPNIQKLAGLFGKEIVLFDSKGPWGGPNGFYTGTDQLFVNAKLTDLHLQLFGHELTHDLYKNAPDLYAALEKVARDNGMTGEETLADYIGNKIGQKQFLDRLANREPQLFERVVSAIRDFVAKVRTLFSAGSAVLKDSQAMEDAALEALARYAKRNGTETGTVKEIQAKFAAEWRGTEPTQAAWDAYAEKDEEVRDKIVSEFLSGDHEHQPWKVVPAAKVKKLWSDYAKTGIVRDEKGLDSVLDSLLENAIRLKFNNEISGHESYSPEGELYSAFGDEWSDADVERFADWAVDLPGGGWRISDYGLPKIEKYLAQALSATSAEEKLTYLDMALNVVHQRSDLAAWFVEGGAQSLSDISGQGAKFSRSDMAQSLNAVGERAKPAIANIVSKGFRVFGPLDRVIDAYSSRPAFAPLKEAMQALKKVKRNSDNIQNTLLTESFLHYDEAMKAAGYQENPLKRNDPGFDKHIEKFHDVRLNGTLWGIFPDKPANEQPWSAKSWVDAGMVEKTGLSLVAAHAQMQADYDALPKALRDTYHKIQDQTSKVSAGYIAALKKKIVDNTQPGPEQDALISKIDERFGSIKGPYTPLMRYGDHVLNVYDQQGGKRLQRLQFESYNDMLKERQSLDAEGLWTEVSKRKSWNREESHIPADFLKAIEDIVRGSGTNNETADGILSDIDQLWFTSLPETSVMKHSLRRSGLAGYDRDSLRGYLSYINKVARATSCLTYGGELKSVMDQMDARVDEQTKAGADPTQLAELVQFFRDQDNYVRTERISPITRALSAVPFLWYLASPSTFLVQSTQPFAFTLPKLASIHGIGESFKAITKGYKNQIDGAFQSEKLERFNDQAEAALELQRVGDTAGMKQLLQGMSPEDKKLLAIKMGELGGTFNISLTHEALDVVTNGGRSKGARFMQNAGFFMRQSELMSRKAAFAAAFDLEFKRTKDFEKAVAYGENVVDDTLFNYSQSNRPVVLTGNLGRLLGQFQTYRLNAVYKMIQLGMDSVRNESPEVRSAARKELAFMMGTVGTMAGATGLPFAGAALAAINFLFGDADDPFDAEETFSSAMRGALGDTAGNVVLKGLPALLGVDVSKRVGMEGMFNLFNGDPPENLKGSDRYNWYAGKLTGPIGGVASGLFRSAESFEKGDWYEAVKAAAPKPIADLTKAIQLYDEGQTTASGKTLQPADNFTMYDWALAAVGIQPLSMSLASEEHSVVSRVSARIADRRAELTGKLARAVATDDSEGRDAAAEEIGKFNRKVPGFALKSSDIANAIKRELNTRNGVKTSKEQQVQGMLKGGL